MNTNTNFAAEVKMSEVVEGETYPLYGMITKILDESPNRVRVEINYSIHAMMHIPEPEKLRLLKERAFEPGIFVAKIINKAPTIIVEVSTVVFGKRATYFDT